MDRQRAAIEKAQVNLERTQHKMKERHDKVVKDHKIQVGCVVYVLIHRRLHEGTSIKLQQVYTGPYLVTDQTSRHTVKLRRLDNIKEIKRPVAIQSIKPLTREMSEEFLDKVVNPTDLEEHLNAVRGNKEDNSSEIKIIKTKASSPVKKSYQSKPERLNYLIMRKMTNLPQEKKFWKTGAAGKNAAGPVYDLWEIRNKYHNT